MTSSSSPSGQPTPSPISDADVSCPAAHLPVDRDQPHSSSQSAAHVMLWQGSAEAALGGANVVVSTVQMPHVNAHLDLTAALVVHRSLKYQQFGSASLQFLVAAPCQKQVKRVSKCAGGRLHCHSLMSIVMYRQKGFNRDFADRAHDARALHLNTNTKSCRPCGPHVAHQLEPIRASKQRVLLSGICRTFQGTPWSTRLSLGTSLQQCIGT